MLPTRNPFVSRRAGIRTSPHTAPLLARKPANISTIWPLDANMATVMATTDHLAPSSKKQHEEQHRCTASCSDPRHPSNAHIVRVTPYYPGPIGCHRHISSGVHTPATLLVLRLLVPIAPFVRLLMTVTVTQQLKILWAPGFVTVIRWRNHSLSLQCKVKSVTTDLRALFLC